MVEREGQDGSNYRARVIGLFVCFDRPDNASDGTRSWSPKCKKRLESLRNKPPVNIVSLVLH